MSCSTYSSKTSYSFLLRLLIIPQISKAATHSSPCPIADTCCLLLHFHKHTCCLFSSLLFKATVFCLYICSQVQTHTPSSFISPVFSFRLPLLLLLPSFSILSSGILLSVPPWSCSPNLIHTLYSQELSYKNQTSLTVQDDQNSIPLEDSLKKLKLWFGFQKN